VPALGWPLQPARGPRYFGTQWFATNPLFSPNKVENSYLDISRISLEVSSNPVMPKSKTERSVAAPAVRRSSAKRAFVTPRFVKD
jgi:hypothetical protein